MQKKKDHSPLQPRSKKRRTNRISDESDEDFDPMNEPQIESESDYHSSPHRSPQSMNTFPQCHFRPHVPSALPTGHNHRRQNIEEEDNDNRTASPFKDANEDNDEHLDRMTLFGHIDDDDDSKTKPPMQREPQYKYKSYQDYKRKTDQRLNSQQLTSTKKAAGASHKNISNMDWYRHPKDKNGRSPDHPNYNKSQIYIPPKALNKMKGAQQQYWKIKSDHFDGILCFKVGKFYEIYEMDADIGHKLLGLSYMGGETSHVSF